VASGNHPETGNGVLGMRVQLPRLYEVRLRARRFDQVEAGTQLGLGQPEEAARVQPERKACGLLF